MNSKLPMTYLLPNYGKVCNLGFILLTKHWTNVKHLFTNPLFEKIAEPTCLYNTQQSTTRERCVNINHYTYSLRLILHTVHAYTFCTDDKNSYCTIIEYDKLILLLLPINLCKADEIYQQRRFTFNGCGGGSWKIQ